MGAVLGVLGLLPVSSPAQTYTTSANDLWDVSQGTVVTATSGANAPYSDIRDMFGGQFSEDEPGDTIFADGQPPGFVHFVEWQTAAPVTVSSFVLFASGDGPADSNQREFSQFVLKAKSSPAATNFDLMLYTLVVTNHPYTFVDPVHLALVAANITPVTAQSFRAEFTQYTAGRGYDGPRVIELDGFGPNPPVIVTQPANTVTITGMNATFSVTANGSVPFGYQWFENGSNLLTAETNATLILTNAQLAQSGNTYSVTISNAYGTTNSIAATLAVNQPVIPSSIDLWDISQGSMVTGTSGAHTPFSDIRDMFGGQFSEDEPGDTVFADGQPPGFVHYVEWQTAVPVNLTSFNLFAAGDGPADNNEREFSQFVLKAKSSPSATNFDLTLYTLVVTNHPYTFVDPVHSALVSANITPVTAQNFRAEFTQYTAGRGYDGPRIIELDGFGPNPPLIVTQPTNQTVAAGANATFTVGATGIGALSYQWFLNGTNALASATNATLTLNNVQPGQSGNNYSVLVSDNSGSTNSAGALLTVNVPVNLLPSSNDLWDISQGSVVTGNSPVNSPFSDIRDMFGGQFSAVEPGNTVFANNQPPGFVHYVEWQTAVPVTVNSFNLFAAGDGPADNNEREFSQFVLKAKSSPSATNFDLTLYTLVVTNHPYTFVDPVHSALVSANITPVTAQNFRAEFTQYTAGRGYDGPRIIELDGFGPNPPAIASQPASQRTIPGMGASFSVTAAGSAPFSYQWFVNGSNQLAMQTNATLVLTNLQLKLEAWKSGAALGENDVGLGEGKGAATGGDQDGALGEGHAGKIRNAGDGSLMSERRPGW